MRLSTLIASTDGRARGADDPDISGLASDSREIRPGFLFVAIPGATHDGRNFITEAVKRGAVAVLMPDNGNSPDALPVSIVTTSDIRKTISSIAAKFYPRQPETIAAVTGTSGKTSTTQFTREIWQATGLPSASIGTLGVVTAKEAKYGSLTTPDAITLHRLLEEIAGQNINHLAMEASSHGLALHRLDDVKVKIGGFTNLSRDHLDFHGTMEEYLAAKLRLFTVVMAPGSTAVLNADTSDFLEISIDCQGKKRHKVISYGEAGKEIKLIAATPHAQGQVLRFELFGKSKEVLLPVIGKFQAWNGLCALGMAIAGGADESKATEALGKVTGVPGRLQLAGNTKNGSAVFVDYAHKPDALENVLKALRPHVAAHKGAKLGVVFGCGGNRDAGKRPIMGEIAQRLADWVIVTDDNPRKEEPAAIRKEILAGCKPGPNLREIGDRGEAIHAAIGMLGANDVLIIAGKGHEPGQIVGDKTLPFDDIKVAQEALK